MRTVEGAVDDDDAAVEVDEYAVVLAMHAIAERQDRWSGGVWYSGVVDCVEDVCVNGDALFCCGRGDVAEGGDSQLGLGAGCAVEEGAVAGGGRGALGMLLGMGDSKEGKEKEGAC